MKMKINCIDICISCISKMACYYALILSLAFGFAQTKCPDGWVVYHDSCYLFSHENVHFVEAENFCKQHGGHLAHITSAAENNFLKSFCIDLKPANHWIGLTDQVVEGEWKYYDTDTVATFFDWYPGQPNEGRQADCAAMWASLDFKWADTSCTNVFQPICERLWETESIVG